VLIDERRLAMTFNSRLMYYDVTDDMVRERVRIIFWLEFQWCACEEGDVGGSVVLLLSFLKQERRQG
jgi:hypothetical protein